MDEQTTVKTNRTAEKNAGSRDWLAFIPYIIAVAALIAYGFFIHFLLGRVGTDEPEWSRSIFLFSGVEAIVFAAAGFLFGREVNRKRAQNAEAEKKLAEKQKEEAKTQAVKERKKALILGAMAVQAEHDGTKNTSGGNALEMAMVNNPLTTIGEKAKRMYPELSE